MRPCHKLVLAATLAAASFAGKEAKALQGPINPQHLTTADVSQPDMLPKPLTHGDYVLLASLLGTVFVGAIAAHPVAKVVNKVRELSL